MKFNDIEIWAATKHAFIAVVNVSVHLADPLPSAAPAHWRNDAENT